MLTYGKCSAISRSSGVSFTVSETGSTPSDIPANILLSPTLKTGCPQGESSYVSGNDNASSRIRCPYDTCCIFTVWSGIVRGTQRAVRISRRRDGSEHTRRHDLESVHH